MRVRSDFPMVLDSPRAWRTYLGGAMLDELHGSGRGDTHFPEEWIMSVVAARNAGRDESLMEGMSHVGTPEGPTLKSCLEADPAAFLGKAHARRLGAQPGVLVKLIDSSERLTIQVHPDRQKAMELFHSPFGKTECWHILGGRRIGGEAPCIYLGFKEGITREKWKRLFDAQDIPGMLDSMHRFEIHKGDTILIEGGVPHAIGAGCFLAEIQEPTDYTIRIERTTPSGFRMADESCHQGLGFDRMFECFHYVGLSREETRKKWFLSSYMMRESRGGAVSKLVDYGDTPFFAMRRLCVSENMTVDVESFCALYVLRGRGRLTAGASMEIEAPRQIFVPAGVGAFTLSAEEGQELEILQFFGPEESEKENTGDEDTSIK